MRTLLLGNGGWLLRVVTITTLVAVIGLSLLPRLVSHISTSATVNARIMTVRSPIEGVIEDVDLATGAPVRRGQTLVTFREADTDLTQLANLATRLRMSEAAGRAVQIRMDEVTALRDSLESRHKAYVSWHAAVLRTEIQGLEAQIRGAAARLRSLERDANWKAGLAGRGSVSESDMLAARNLHEEQRAALLELEARRDGRRLMLRALLDDGILAGTTGTNTPYTRQRQDEIGLELARLRDELTDHAAEQQAIRDQIDQARKVYEQENRVTLVSPVSGVVWRSAALSGRPVLPGDEVIEILDCGTRFLEAYLPERLMGTIALGDTAEVRLTGEPRVFRAPVISVLGHGARFDHADLAAEDDTPKTGKMRVLIELDAASLDPEASRFCDVGRTAQVSLRRDLPGLGGIMAGLGRTVDRVTAWVAATADGLRRG